MGFGGAAVICQGCFQNIGQCSGQRTIASGCDIATTGCKLIKCFTIGLATVTEEIIIVCIDDALFEINFTAVANSGISTDNGIFQRNSALVLPDVNAPAFRISRVVTDCGIIQG
ncbi:hypothetical protein GMJAKD_17830 [Candidatus Electrothrix aarhusensis]